MKSVDTVQAVQRLFVYGSLKEGFPNFHINRGRRIAGQFRTVLPHSLHLVNGRLPCLLPLPRQPPRTRRQFPSIVQPDFGDCPVCRPRRFFVAIVASLFA